MVDTAAWRACAPACSSDIHEPDQHLDGAGRHYDMGLGHLHDAHHKFADQKASTQTSWSDVSSVLGLLSQEKWYRQTRHGYARGFEAKVFVESIQRYYQTLLWMDTHEHPLLVAGL